MDNQGQEKPKFSRPFVLGIILSTLLLGIAAGVVLDRSVINKFVPPENITRDAAPSFQIMAQAWNTIKGVYIDQSSASPEALTYGALKGMVDSLGDKGHSRFLTPDMVKQVKKTVHGAFVGIGVELQLKDGVPTVLAPIDNSPASEAGIKPGDTLVKADGHDLIGLTVDQVVKIVQGPPGSRVTLEVRTPETGLSRELILKRRKLAMNNVTWTTIPGTTIVHIRLGSFAYGTSRDLARTLKTLSDNKSLPVTGIILDVRSNPGGLLQEAIGTASQFLKDGTVVGVRDAKGNVKQMQTEGKALAPDMPMVVLINNGTASAAEIIAGAFQDRKRAVLIGEKTVGTGTVLQQYHLDDGSALLLATHEWLTPSGRAIWHKGIEPDIPANLTGQTRPLLPRVEKSMTLDQVKASGDSQLLAAIDFLKNGSQQDKAAQLTDSALSLSSK